MACAVTDRVRERILREVVPFVEKPSRYIGREFLTVHKNLEAAAVRVALAFPDVYEIGMSHLGLKFLYQLLNRRPEVVAERVYCPWLDFEALARRRGIPLASIESGLPLRAFDLVGFTLQYELSYATILHMLELGGIPLRSADRGEGDPFVVAGGPCAYSPEPIADFVDCFVIGDGEEAIHDLVDTFLAWRRAGGRREELLQAWAALPGMYVPACWQPGQVIEKRTVTRLDTIDYAQIPVPFMEIVHDRVNIEVMRGCTVGCRFCQAGMVYRPLRELPADEIREMTQRALAATGYEEASLNSLSIADLSCLSGLIPKLMDDFQGDRIGLSLPSLRVKGLKPELAGEILRVKRTGFTIAPEAGSQRLREVINKGIVDEEEVFRAVTAAAEAGWTGLKMYFMCGLPTETQADLEELVRLSLTAQRLGRKRGPRGFGLTVSVSSFVPKPHTPFQWAGQDRMEVLREKQQFLKARLREGGVKFKWHDVKSSFLEAVFSRGGRETGPVIAEAHRRGARLDGWSEHLDFDRWMAAFEACGVDPFPIAHRNIGPDEPLPWDHISCGVSKKFHQREWRKALRAATTPDCHVAPCQACGAVCIPSWQGWHEHAEAERLEAKRKEAANGLAAAGGGNGKLMPLRVLPATPGGDGAPLARVEPAVTAPPAPAAEAPPSVAAVQRIRFAFQKRGELRFLSHLEVFRTLTRAIRRAGYLLAYTQGYNPQPRLAVAMGLPVGVEGEAELADVELRERAPVEDFPVRVNATLPPELHLTGAWEGSLAAPSLTSQVLTARYRATLSPSLAGALAPALEDPAAACAAFLARETIPVDGFRKGEAITVDARPALEAFRPDGPGGFLLLLKAGAGVRPREVLRAFLAPHLSAEDLAGLDGHLTITRTGLGLTAAVSPTPAPAPA
ncbi:MAG: TIGR03960 family B12-binding radical SAM protein [Candidatus Methylomirabilales bacterium]